PVPQPERIGDRSRDARLPRSARAQRGRRDRLLAVRRIAAARGGKRAGRPRGRRQAGRGRVVQDPPGPAELRSAPAPAGEPRISADAERGCGLWGGVRPGDGRGVPGADETSAPPAPFEPADWIVYALRWAARQTPPHFDWE